MRKAFLPALLLAIALPLQAAAISSVLPGASQRGAAVYRYLGFPLYEARLFTQGGAPLDWSEEFGLELRYMRDLTQYDLVEGTMRELSRTGRAIAVRGQLEKCFDAVQKGDRYLAVTDGPDRIGFWLNGNRTCTLSHPGIKNRFMGIFLGDNSRSKSFTRKLLG